MHLPPYLKNFWVDLQNLECSIVLQIQKSEKVKSAQRQFLLTCHDWKYMLCPKCVKSIDDGGTKCLTIALLYVPKLWEKLQKKNEGRGVK